MKTRRRPPRAPVPRSAGTVIPRRENLNDRLIPGDSEAYSRGDRMLDDHRKESHGVRMVACRFRDLATHLVNEIGDHDAVFGCMAWLTDRAVLEALAKVDCSIVVQSEDFIRQDPAVDQRGLRDLYGALHCGLERFAFPFPLSSMSVCGDPSLDPIRMIAAVEEGAKNARSLMHHKFLVFCKIKRTEEPGDSFGDRKLVTVETIVPERVWTGSFNATYNGRFSLENAVIIEDEPIAYRYLQEFAQLAAISVPLDWDFTDGHTQWRLGT